MTVEACPECDGTTSVYAREWGPDGVRVAPAERYRCGECEATFPEPTRRPPKRALATNDVIDGGDA